MIIDNFVKFLDEIFVENTSEDYWYDVGVDEVQNMLRKFSREEWKLLGRLIKIKSTEWQKKVIYSFDEKGNDKEIKIIMDFNDTDDNELFEICIDSLRYLINEKTQKLIWEKPELLEKIQSIILKNNSITKSIYIDFLERVGKPWT